MDAPRCQNGMVRPCSCPGSKRSIPVISTRVDQRGHIEAPVTLMPGLSRKKITFAEMRESGVRRTLIYCADYKCSHLVAISGDAWPDDVRLSDIEPRFVCKVLRQAGC